MFFIVVIKMIHTSNTDRRVTKEQNENAPIFFFFIIIISHNRKRGSRNHGAVRSRLKKYTPEQYNIIFKRTKI